MAAKAADQSHLKDIATPSRLAAKLFPFMYGTSFHFASWIAYAERRIIDAIMSPEQRFIMLNVPPRHGKALEVSTPIPTPDGWSTIGDLRTGDTVYGPDGSTATVVAHAPYMADTFIVTFDDGSTIECDGDHLWTTIDKNHAATWTEHRGAGWRDDWWEWVAPGKGGCGGRAGNTKDASGSARDGTAAVTSTTVEIMDRMRSGGEVPRVPNGRIEGVDVELPIDPYILGYWLGDGTTSEPAITVGNADRDHLLAACATAGLTVSVQCRPYAPTVSNVRLLGCRRLFRELGLLGTKHIPDVYMRASAAQRRSLLAGLLDSDGTDADGAADLSQQNRRLALQVEELACSLGAKVSTSTREAKLNGRSTGATVWRQRITSTFNPFQLQRKADAWAATPPKLGLRGQRIIKNIEASGRRVKVRCLTTSHPSGLYLAGRQMVPTHNTTYAGIYLPAWFLGLNPAKRVIFSSYGDEYSARYGRAVRTIIDTWGRQLFGVSVDKSAQSASDWQMAGTMGGMLSTGAGGVLTGYGGDLIVVDDLLKGPEDAASETVKRKQREWYWDALRTRLHPGGTLLMTVTRWADDDLPGHIEELQRSPDYAGDRWEIVKFKALAEPDEDEEVVSFEEWVDLLGRHVGEALAPEQGWTAEVLRQIREGNPDKSRWFCLYQQTPIIVAGGMFPRNCWQYWNNGNLPTITRRVRVWDLAASAESGDWTVGVLMGVSPSGDIYVLERERFKLASHEVEQRVKAAAARDGFAVKIIIEQEKAGAGKTVVEHYQRELRGYTVEPGKVDGTKEERATPYSSMQQQLRVWLPEGAEWLDEWRNEHRAMIGDGRRGRHDDQIDAAAFGVRDLLQFGASDIWIPGEMRQLALHQLMGVGADVLAFPSMEAQMEALRGERLFEAFLRAAA
jgi:predicted phage terminase large subunit-like protein